MKKFLILCLALVLAFCLVSCGDSDDNNEISKTGQNSAENTKNDYSQKDSSDTENSDEMDGYFTKTEKEAERLDSLKKEIEQFIGAEFVGNLVSVDCGMQNNDGTEPTSEYDFSKVRIEIEFAEKEDAALLYEYLMGDGAFDENEFAKSKFKLNDNVVVMTLELLNID